MDSNTLDHNPKSRAAIAGHPLHPMVIPFPIVLFVTAFMTDIGFLVTASEGWARVGVWLIGGGLVTAAVAALLGLIDFLGDRGVRAVRASWMHMFANVAAVALELVNFVMRMNQGADAVAPAGIAISGIVVLLLIFSGWMGGEMVYKHHIGVRETRPPV